MTTTLPRAVTPNAITTGAIRARAKQSVSLTETARQSLTMAYRGVLKLRHNPEQLFDVTIMPIIFTVMFTYIFGGAISGNVSSYLPVIIPGILVQTVVMSSIVTGTQLREDMDKGVFDRFRSLPIARISPLAGALLADVIRYLRWFTFLGEGELSALETEVAERPFKREAQRRLAQEMTDLVHGEEATKAVELAAQALFGRGEPGGTVNLVTKRPTFQRAGELRLSAGSFDTYRVDVGRGLAVIAPNGYQISYEPAL